MADYVDTVFNKAGEDSVTAESWGEHWQLIWEGWTPASVQPVEPNLDRPASRRYVLEAIEDVSGGGPHTHVAAEVTDLETEVASIVTPLLGDSDAELRDRSTHTGAQSISTVTGLQAALDAKIAKGEVAAFEVLTQAEMDALIAGSTTVATTFYVING